MQSNAKVTVVTAVLNGADTIKTCLASVSRQSYADIEHLVIDGGSDDGTIKILADTGVRFESAADAGIYDAFNRGIAGATGDIVHILNADDAYADDGVVARMVGFMEEGGYELVHAKVMQTDQLGAPARLVGQQVSKRQLLRKCRVAHPSVFVRREVYERFGTYSAGFRIAADHEFFLRIWDEIRVGYLPEVVVNMRLGGASNSQVYKSYAESAAAALMHGGTPLAVAINFYWELVKSRILQVAGKTPRPTARRSETTDKGKS